MVWPHWRLLPSSGLQDWKRTFTGLRLGSPQSKEVLMELTRSAPALERDSWQPCRSTLMANWTVVVLLLSVELGLTETVT